MRTFKLVMITGAALLGFVIAKVQDPVLQDVQPLSQPTGGVRPPKDTEWWPPSPEDMVIIEPPDGQPYVMVPAGDSLALYQVPPHKWFVMTAIETDASMPSLGYPWCQSGLLY